MPFTAQDKDDLRTYMGYASRGFQFDTELEQAMAATDGDAQAVATIQALIVRAKAIDTNLAAMDTRAKAVKLGSLELDAHREMAYLRSQGRQVCGRIASKLGVSVRHDAFSASLPNDSRLPLPRYPDDSAGNVMKLG